MEPVAHGITYLQCQKPSGASPEGNKEMIRSSPVYTPDRWCDIVSCHRGGSNHWWSVYDERSGNVVAALAAARSRGQVSRSWGVKPLEDYRVIFSHLP